MNRFLPLVLIILGIVTIFAGFIYDVLFAGIPYQDPTPAMTANYDFHAWIASIIRWSGMAFIIFGGIIIIFRKSIMKASMAQNRNSE